MTTTFPSDRRRLDSAADQPLVGLLQQLSQFPLQGGQIQPPFSPLTAVDLAQQPETVLTQLFDQGGGVRDLRGSRGVCRGAPIG